MKSGLDSMDIEEESRVERCGRLTFSSFFLCFAFKTDGRAIRWTPFHTSILADHGKITFIWRDGICS